MTEQNAASAAMDRAGGTSTDTASATVTTTTAPTPGTVQARNDNPASPNDITGGDRSWKVPDFAKDWAPEDQGYLEKKGYNDPRKIYDAARAAERLISSEHVSLPKDWNDAEQVKKFYDKVGRPESADKYVAPQGADANLIKALAPDLHTAGLTQRQLDQLSASINKYNEGEMAKIEAAWIKDGNDSYAKLEREWGPNVNREIELTRRAERALGMTKEQRENYMKGGTEMFMRLLNAAGRYYAEDDSGDIASDATMGFGNTPNRAAADLEQLRSDKAFMDKVRARDPAAKQKYDRLIRAAAEGGLTRNTIKGGFHRAQRFDQ